ncbi:ATPase [Epidermidibacterium keratini]|uniref:ATPase n=1 Tax=Epidermidibacterium keratini TaxID=1891644 RepID=A0A7L4YQY7_9ACTN|nr:sensor histidine kinase [Epidermidibacterium keratini]QHC01665.1 ATPase [Epidermidibacterium keratini]
MSTVDELLAQYTDLEHADAEHLHQLIGEWQLLADLSFADLVLWVPTRTDEIVCIAHVRPTTGPTAYQQDLIGTKAQAPYADAIRRALRGDDPPGRVITDGRDAFAVRREPDGRVIAALTRRRQAAIRASSSALEMAYLESSSSLLWMVANGTFPPAHASAEMMTGPRAGDGLVLLDARGVVRYASPNAMSAYRRMGLIGDLLETDFREATRSLVRDPMEAQELDGRIESALGGNSPLRIEVDGRGATVLFRALALQRADGPAGALILLRDVTDVRRRDRQLLSKDATIREIHHRVKNNLQTVAALLRLQARRVPSSDAKSALVESVRRVRSIALVHETLSMSLDESVDFDGIVDRLIPMVADVAAPESVVHIRRDGAFGILPAEIATPLVLVVVELLQNAVEHAFSARQRGEVAIRPVRRPGKLIVTVRDDGRGLPDDFDLTASNRLGLQIATTLVETEMRGAITVENAIGGPGTEAIVQIPLAKRRPR